MLGAAGSCCCCCAMLRTATVLCVCVCVCVSVCVRACVCVVWFSVDAAFCMSCGHRPHTPVRLDAEAGTEPADACTRQRSTVRGEWRCRRQHFQWRLAVHWRRHDRASLENREPEGAARDTRRGRRRGWSWYHGSRGACCAHDTTTEAAACICRITWAHLLNLRADGVELHQAFPHVMVQLQQLVLLGERVQP